MSAPDLPRHAWVEQIMGMPISVHLRGGGLTARQPDCVTALFAELRAVDALFSTYRPDSQISRLAAGELDLADCHPWVTEVLGLCERATQLTDGWFDALLPAGDGTLTLDPSGLVKGWAVARATAELARAWPADAYVNAGGDIALVSRSGQPWRVGVADPAGGLLGALPLTDGGIATSGTEHRGAHIVDPKTRRPATALRSVTVVGPDLLWADVLATALFARGRLDLDVPWLTGYRALLVGSAGERAGTLTLQDV